MSCSVFVVNFYLKIRNIKVNLVGMYYKENKISFLEIKDL